MKIIDLLVKISRGEELPKKFKYDGLLFERDSYYHYVDNDGFELEKSICSDLSNLNAEVEIIEDTPKGIEKIDISKFPKKNNSLKKTAIKVNEIIDKLNNLDK